MKRDLLYARTERLSYAVIVASLLVLALLWLTGCKTAPPTLSPEAKIAFHATRVVQVLDVFRDAAIAANEQTPPLVSTDSTRVVVLFHQSAVRIIRATPNGWVPIVKAGLFELTCHPLASATRPPPPCTPKLAQAEVVRLYPYVGLAMIVIDEVQ